MGNTCTSHYQIREYNLIREDGSPIYRPRSQGSGQTHSSKFVWNLDQSNDLEDCGNSNGGSRGWVVPVQSNRQRRVSSWG
jgi:hypothetical protein